MKNISFIVIFLIVSLTSFTQTVSDLRPTVTMKEYVDMQMELNRQMDDIRAKNLENNTAAAMASMDKRLDGMNEFRGTIEDNNRTFIQRNELFAWVITLIMTFFAYSNYRSNQVKSKNETKAIHSGDTVEVKK